MENLMTMPPVAHATVAETSATTTAVEGTNGELRERNGNGNGIFKPNLEEPQLLKPQVTGGSSDEALSSGTATPLPEDAPPSAVSISVARRVRRRLFPTIAYESRVSHFDPASQHHDFRGFFSLFWVGLVIMLITTVLRNLKENGSIMRTNIFSLFAHGPFELGIADLAMVASTGFVLPLQQMYAKGGIKMGDKVIRWDKEGHWIQHALQAVWLAIWVYLPFFFNWQWTRQVFFTLHALTLLMKIHSYSFYSGHLSECHQKLKSLDLLTPEKETTEQSELRETLAFELTSPDGRVTYPNNLTRENFVDYMLCPTLCYELSYPRVPTIRIEKLLEKSSAVFGCVFLLTVVSEEYILPVMQDAHIQLAASTGYYESFLILLESISLLLFPYMITFLLVFLVIFEYVLGFFAELTRFGDRHFYSDWWNCSDWLEFSRMWNVPVHRFLQRHVYSISRPRHGRPVAYLVTFLISALAHELVMFCLTKKLRGYGFVCQMLQLPIVAIQRIPLVKAQRRLNNVLFWVSMIWGLSMISSLYVLL
ncbi:Similar to Probable sterol O-acyltransferase 2; acc. no. Q9UU82 [Pyronema omphalodes CBS 100304]|uniref:O-acyltransferase n=1 Tax=Pyronema omphalodes (strain CBS 100304) TaxID=1076935 RepID=U4KV27_PYROM|nr:Similar to Probable sterol O-acyltransferase 2; acc. no. Q9UU82 [Pyronema omphalodes CBS 100304]